MRGPSERLVRERDLGLRMRGPSERLVHERDLGGLGVLMMFTPSFGQ